MLYRGKVYVPLDAKLCLDIVAAHHNTPSTGHPGRWKTMELVSRNYWWPGMSRYIATYVSECVRCNETKSFPQKPSGKLLPNRIPDRRWQVITMDMIVGLPESQGYDCILIVVDRLSKCIHAIPTDSKIDSLGTAKLFRDHVWRHHGLPEEIISDRGPQFVSKFMRELNNLLGIKTSASTAFHPQTDGQTERVNQEIEQYLRTFINKRQDNWVEWLPLAEFAYNDRVHSSTRTTLFRLNTGQDPRLGIEPRRTPRVQAASDFAEQMLQATNKARAALKLAADDMARFYDVHRAAAPEYKIGNKVWLDAKDIRTSRPSKKLDNKWFGPFEITKLVNQNAYELKLPASFNRVHPVFNVVKLRQYTEPSTPGRRSPSPPPEPDIIDKELHYEVQEILNSRRWRRKLQYLVKWVGYPALDNSWENASDCAGAPEAIANYHQDHPNAPR